jgi:hypothetical protein
MSAQFGPYRLAAVLSRGPSATVYRAHDTSHDDRVVALKVFGPELSANPAFRERFRRDAGRLSALREPHVVPIHRHGEIDGRLFLDMRLVRGPSLADVLRDGPLAPPARRRSRDRSGRPPSRCGRVASAAGRSSARTSCSPDLRAAGSSCSSSGSAWAGRRCRRGTCRRPHW